MVVNYQERKNEVLASYETVENLVADMRDYAAQIELPDPAIKLETLLSDIRSKAAKVKEDRFNIMIAGESKSGKSTFINAYLGVELLPMDVKQCTSSIVEIKYGKQFSVKATYADGRQKEITNEKEAHDFLKQNAALDDNFRDIPVPTINSEILVKSGLRAREKGHKISISEAEVKAMLNSPEVKAANIYNIPNYNSRIRAYIELKKKDWQDIVTKIEILFPFDDSLRGVEIIDTPGVCARGGVSEITTQYIKNADAVIFLKPIIGQSLESTQFNQFMENVSVERNKNALFLVLTHIATKTEEDLHRLEEEAYKQFSGKLDKRNILFVDSKEELYSKKFAKIENIQQELTRLNKEGKLDDFVKAAYLDTNTIFGEGDFITVLHDKSRFDQVYQALEMFGRRAHYILLGSLLDSICKLYSKLWNDTDSQIKLFQQKAEDPKIFANKIKNIKDELADIEEKTHCGVFIVTQRYTDDDDGIIRMEIEAAANDYSNAVEKIPPDSSDAFQQLERLCLKKIEQFKSLQEKIQQQMVKDFDEELIKLSDKSSIPFESLQPNFTEETFKQIKEETESDAYETHSYEEGLTFKKTHTYSVYVQNKHFLIIKNSIETRLAKIKEVLSKNLMEFVNKIQDKYTVKLSENAKIKEEELNTIEKAKQDAEQIQMIISGLSAKASDISKAQTEATKLKGGILKYVQN